MRQSTLDGFESIDYTDPEWLRSRYYDAEMTLEEMAELAGAGISTIRRHMDKHGMERRSSAETARINGTQSNAYSETKDHNRREWLVEKHYAQNLSLKKMAEAGDVEVSTIIRNMRENDVEIKPDYVTRAYRKPGAGFKHADSGGYETIQHTIDGEKYDVKIHRLIAVAEYGFDEVADSIVHHGKDSGDLPATQIPWANWGGNLELMEGRAEHTRHHYHNGWEVDPDTGKLV